MLKLKKANAYNMHIVEHDELPRFVLCDKVKYELRHDPVGWRYFDKDGNDLYLPSQPYYAYIFKNPDYPDLIDYTEAELVE